MTEQEFIEIDPFSDFAPNPFETPAWLLRKTRKQTLKLYNILFSYRNSRGITRYDSAFVTSYCVQAATDYIRQTRDNAVVLLVDRDLRH